MKTGETLQKADFALRRIKHAKNTVHSVQRKNLTNFIKSLKSGRVYHLETLKSLNKYADLSIVQEFSIVKIFF